MKKNVKLSEVRSVVIRLPKGTELPIRIEFFDPKAEVEGQSAGAKESFRLEGPGALAWNCGCGTGSNCVC